MNISRHIPLEMIDMVRGVMETYPRDATIVERISLIPDVRLLIVETELATHICPLLDQKQFLTESTRSQRIPREEHFRPGSSGCSFVLGGEVAMDANHIHGWAIESRIGEILDSINALGTRNSTRDHGDTSFSQAHVFFEMCCYFT